MAVVSSAGREVGERGIVMLLGGEEEEWQAEVMEEQSGGGPCCAAALGATPHLMEGGAEAHKPSFYQIDLIRCTVIR